MAQAFLHAGRTRQTANRTIANMMAITPELSNLSTQALRSITEQVVSSRPRTEQQAEQRTQQAFLQHLQKTNPRLARLAEERLSAQRVPGETERGPAGGGHSKVPAKKVPGETERGPAGGGHSKVPAEKVPGETESSTRKKRPEGDSK